MRDLMGGGLMWAWSRRACPGRPVFRARRLWSSMISANQWREASDRKMRAPHSEAGACLSLKHSRIRHCRTR
jgi:hypothetical protein